MVEIQKQNPAQVTSSSIEASADQCEAGEVLLLPSLAWELIRKNAITTLSGAIPALRIRDMAASRESPRYPGSTTQSRYPIPSRVWPLCALKLPIRICSTGGYKQSARVRVQQRQF